MKKKIIVPVVVVLICSVLAVVYFVSNRAAWEKRVYVSSPYGRAVKLFEIAYGSAEEQLYRTDIVEDAEILGPKSFTIDRSGNFYVLDTLQDKIKIFSDAGEYLDTIDLPQERYGLDLEIMDENLFLYDDDDHLYRIRTEDPTQMDVITTVPRWCIEGIYRAGEELFIRSYNGADKVITTKDGGKQWNVEPDKTVIGLRKEGEERSDRQAETITYDLTCRLLPAGACCLKREEGILYTLSNESGSQYVETIISKIENGKVIGRALTISGRIYDYDTPFKTIYINNDVVYQMVPEENALAFYRIPWTMDYETRFSAEELGE